DVLGLTPDQWEAMFTNTNNLSENIQKVGAAIQVAQQLFGAYSEFVQANEQRMLQQAEVASQRKQTSLDKRLKAGLINQETYKKLTLSNEKELDRKKAEIEYQSAKRQRALQIGETIANTAMSIMSIWAQVPKFDFGVSAGILSGVVGALGAVKLATIMSAPLPTAPGAEDGFYPVLREQDNKLFRARKRKSQTGMYNEATMLVGEQGRNFPELVVAGEDLKRVDPNITNMFMRDIQRVRGFEKGLYPDISTAPIKSNNNDEVMLKILHALELNNETMQDIKRTGLRANIEKTAQNGKSIEEMIEDYNNIKNRNKHG
ncbi:MAG: phage tail tape measure protein, partial [Soonwooa sp.]